MILVCYLGILALLSRTLQARCILCGPLLLIGLADEDQQPKLLEPEQSN